MMETLKPSIVLEKMKSLKPSLSLEELKALKPSLSLQKLKSLQYLFQPTPVIKASSGSGANFQWLPADIIIIIMFEIEDVQDLYSFVLTSPFIYHLFPHHKITLLNRFARTLLGDSWHEGVELLIWQRNTNPTDHTPNYASVIRDLSSPFVLHDRDLCNLTANQRWFENCRSLYINTYQQSMHRPPRQSNRTWTWGKARPPRIPAPTLRHFLGAEPGELFPQRLFYITWLLQYRFRWECLEAFGSRTRAEPVEMLDTFLMSRTMYCSKEFDQFVHLGRRGSIWERVCLFTIWNQPPVVRDEDLWVRQKVLTHVVAKSELEREQGVNLQEWAGSVRVLVEHVKRDFDRLDLETVMELYELH